MTGLRVLVCEDNAVNRDMMGLMLKALGINSVLVEDGEAAVAALASPLPGEIFDAVVLDHHLPGMTGLEALHVIRKLGLTIPVIITTADDLVSGAQAFLDAGANACLSKPVEVAELVDVIQRVVSTKS